MPRTLIELSASVTSDVLALVGLPTSTLSEAFKQFLSHKIEDAQDILLKQMRAGEMSEHRAASQDDAIAILYRYGLTARDGAARRNLRLLAKAVVGLASRDRLNSDEFNKYANVLARLTKDQIFVLGRFQSLACRRTA